MISCRNKWNEINVVAPPPPPIKQPYSPTGVSLLLPKHKWKTSGAHTECNSAMHMHDKLQLAWSPYLHVIWSSFTTAFFLLPWLIIHTEMVSFHFISPMSAETWGLSDRFTVEKWKNKKHVSLLTIHNVPWEHQYSALWTVQSVTFKPDLSELWWKY